MFERNQKVVCLDDSFHPEIAYLYKNLPIKNEVYTVRDCVLGTTNSWSGNAYDNVSYKVLLEELINDIDPHTIDGCKEELGFKSDRFREVEQLHDEEKDSVLIGVGTDKKEFWQ